MPISEINRNEKQSHRILKYIARLPYSQVWEAKFSLSMSKYCIYSTKNTMLIFRRNIGRWHARVPAFHKFLYFRLKRWDTDAIWMCMKDVIMDAIGSQITSLAIVYPTVYSGADQRKHQNSASLAFVRGCHRGPVNSPHKWPVTRKMSPFDDVIMTLILILCAAAQSVLLVTMDYLGTGSSTCFQFVAAITG